MLSSGSEGVDIQNMVGADGVTSTTKPGGNSDSIGLPSGEMGGSRTHNAVREVNSLSKISEATDSTKIPKTFELPIPVADISTITAWYRATPSARKWPELTQILEFVISQAEPEPSARSLGLVPVSLSAEESHVKTALEDFIANFCIIFM